MPEPKNIYVARAEQTMRDALKHFSAEDKDIVDSAVRQVRLHASIQLAREAKKEKRKRRALPLFE